MTDDSRGVDEQELEAGLRALAREDAALQATDDVEARVMRVWDAAQVGRRPVPHRFASRGLRVAAALVLLAAGTYWLTGASSRSASRAGLESRESVMASAWPSDEVQAWLELDPGPLQVVRVGVSRAALVAQGYAVNDPDGDGLVEIDVVVGTDGVPRTLQLAAAPFYRRGTP
jgi:hypothetical protein